MPRVLVKLLQAILSGEANTVACADCGMFTYKIIWQLFFPTSIKNLKMWLLFRDGTHSVEINVKLSV